MSLHPAMKIQKRWFRPAAVRHVACYERVLGTSLELQILAETLERGRAAELAVLQEIDRLERIFSAYRADSELRRWYRDAQATLAGGGPDLVATISSATRMPGKYSLVWDGKDDKGNPVLQGAYTFNLETAREHGPYQLMQKEITIGPKPFKAEVAGNTETKGATLEYRKRK